VLGCEEAGWDPPGAGAGAGADAAGLAVCEAFFGATAVCEDAGFAACTVEGPAGVFTPACPWGFGAAATGLVVSGG